MNVQKIDLSDCDTFNAHNLHSQKVEGFLFSVLSVLNNIMCASCFPLNNKKFIYSSYNSTLFEGCFGENWIID